MAFKVGSFVADVPGTGTVQSVNVGFQPDLVLLFHGTMTGPGTVSGAYQYSFSWALNPAGSSPYANNGFMPISFSPPTSAYFETMRNFYFFDTDGLLLFEDAALNILGYGALDSFYASGFNIAWDPHADFPNTDPFVVYYVAMSGVSVWSDEVSLPSGTSAITGLGFQPNLVLGWIINSANYVSSSIGFGDADLNQFAISTKTGRDADTGILDNATKHASLLASVYRIDSFGFGTAAVDVTLSSLDSDGFTVNSSYTGLSGTILGSYLEYIALNYNDVVVGSFTLNTSTGSQSITGVGVAPELLLFEFSGCGESSPDSTKSQFGMGAVGTDLTSFSFCSLWTNAGTIEYKFSDTTCIETGVSSSEYSVEITSLDSDGFTVNILTAATSPAPTVRYIAFGPGSAVATDFFRRIEGMEMPPKETHYMSIPHATAGIAKSAWTINLYKQGERVTDVPVDVVENPDGHYTFSFVNDGQHEKIWNLTAYPTATPTSRYAQSWIVKKRITESTVKYLRSKADSESGFFKSNVNKE